VTRVHVIVEGTTEESFIQELLAPKLLFAEIYLIPTILGVPGHKGGRTNYARVRKDVLKHLQGDRTAYCSTMLDFYGLGQGFPGTPPPPNLSSLDKVLHLERAMKEDVATAVPNLRPHVRFLPYLQLHEYEGLLFSNPEAFANGISQAHLAAPFRDIRQKVPTPEDIDDNPDTAPSKRILRLCPSYNKVLDGTRAATAVGIEAMRRECPHFRDWVERLAKVGSLSF